MRFDILTLFPDMFYGPLNYSIVKRATENKLVEIFVHDLRDWSDDKYKSVDDRPYGGGPGMILRVDVIDKAITSIKSMANKKAVKTILLDAGGENYTQNKAYKFGELEQIILIAGHYEGVDRRVAENVADESISIGSYILSGGEIPSMVIIDSVVRLIPGVLGNADSLTEESHNNSEVEYPQYTRPQEYKGWQVPEVLLGGNHRDIQRFRKGNLS